MVVRSLSLRVMHVLRCHALVNGGRGHGYCVGICVRSFFIEKMSGYDFRNPLRERQTPSFSCGVLLDSLSIDTP